MSALPKETTMAEPLTLIAFLRARAGAEEELGRRLAALIEPTLREPGCIDYQLHRSNCDPAVWVLYENWRSQAAVDLHFQMPYLRQMLADFPGLLSKDMELHHMHKVSAGEIGA